MERKDKLISVAYGFSIGFCVSTAIALLINAPTNTTIIYAVGATVFGLASFLLYMTK